jgi:uncharacterized protein (DUF849 family)
MMRADRAETLLRAALDRGLHVRVGIGDSPYAHPAASNPELVARAVELVRAAGYEPATPAAVRSRLGLTQ